MYGELINQDENIEKYKSRKVTKGWFPKKCVKIDKNQKLDENDSLIINDSTNETKQEKVSKKKNWKFTHNYII